MAESSQTKDFNPDYWVWGEDEIKPRLLHAMIRVKDFQKSLHFYVDTLGMKVLDKFDVEIRRATGLFIGYGNYRESALLELTQKWDVDEYSHGDAFGHVAIGVPDLPGMVKENRRGRVRSHRPAQGPDDWRPNGRVREGS